MITSGRTTSNKCDVNNNWSESIYELIFSCFSKYSTLICPSTNNSNSSSVRIGFKPLIALTKISFSDNSWPFCGLDERSEKLICCKSSSST